MELSSFGATAVPDWGDVPTWIGGIATFGALAAAVFAGIVTRRLYQVEVERDRDAELERRARHDDDRKAQARQVYGWINQYGGLPDREGGRWPEAMVLVGTFPMVVVRNRSHLPIYDVHATVIQDGYRRGPSKLGAIAPGEESTPWPWLMEGEPQAWTNTTDYVKWLHNLRVEVDFVDAGSLHWRRDPSGQLMELPGPR